jgi:hypothetical protein
MPAFARSTDQPQLFDARERRQGCEEARPAADDRAALAASSSARDIMRGKGLNGDLTGCRC